MKKYLFIPLFALATTALFAQPEHGHEAFREKKEKMNAMKAAYITAELNLSAEESQRFWPIYNEMDAKIEALRMGTFGEMKALRNGGKNIDEVPDADLQRVMKARFANEEQIAKIKAQYHDKFVKELGVKKTAKLYLAEMDFMRDLMRKSKGHSKEGGKK